MLALEKLNARMTAANSLVCVGLDSEYAKLPERFLQHETPQFAFNQWIIDQTHPFVAAYKPNLAFYEARGTQGLTELALTIRYLRRQHPEIFTIADAKRADIGNTNAGYVKAMFDELDFDAITLHPYLGREALEPFLERADKACIVLCKTSNPGSDEIQNLSVEGGKQVWELVAEKVSREWNQYGNCMLVVGATYPAEIKRVREIVGEMPLLVPGIGAQGGDLEATLQAGLTKEGRGLLINAARSVIFAENPGAEAEKLQLEINSHRNS